MELRVVGYVVTAALRDGVDLVPLLEGLAARCATLADRPARAWLTVRVGDLDPTEAAGVTAVFLRVWSRVAHAWPGRHDRFNADLAAAVREVLGPWLVRPPTEPLTVEYRADDADGDDADDEEEAPLRLRELAVEEARRLLPALLWAEARGTALTVRTPDRNGVEPDVVRRGRMVLPL